jgi:hypothetical protein
MNALVRRIAVCFLLGGLASVQPVRAAAIPEDVINRAVERGVAALKSQQQADGSFGARVYRSAPTALAALAMLECGVAADDPQIARAAAYVRNDCPDMSETYHLAVAIMFFDRLGDPLDESLIHNLTVRLLEGQQPIGAWTYTSSSVGAEDAKTIRTILQKRSELKTAPGGPSGERPPPSADVLERARLIQQWRTPPAAGGTADNSNTQFALLGLWVGRRHGLDTGPALGRAEAYFRASHFGGRWPYRPGSDAGAGDGPANTCSGLIGLAIGAGLVRERQLHTGDERTPGKDGKAPRLRDPLRDPVVQAAMNFVGGQVATLAARGLTGDPMRDLYFLWSAERTGMIYSVAVMGGVNWYHVGAASILRAQLPDGSWAGGSGNGLTDNRPIGTSFALLFLKRSNVANDLTANLRKKLSQQVLRAGNEKGEPAEVELPLSEAERLAQELASAVGERQAALLQQLRDGKGAEFTEALAHAIAVLDGNVQKEARNALAERLARMTSGTLRAKLKDPNAEVRRAAALACAMKSDRELVADLIRTLDDSDRWVTRAAAVALRTLTGEDFGPSASASAEERAKSILAWKAWWKAQSRP